MKPQLIHFQKLKYTPVNDQIGRKMVTGVNTMLLEHSVKKGFRSTQNETHVNEQITYVLKGRLQVESAGELMVLEPGDLILIPPNQPHTLEALEDTVILDVFSPIRKEWIEP